MSPASRCLRFTVGHEDQGLRLDRFLAVKLAEHAVSREKVKRLIKDGLAGVEGVEERSPKLPVCAGSTVFALLPESRSNLLPEEGDLTVVYRDSSLAVISKPPGLTVHPAPGLESGTLAHRLVAHFPELAAQEGFRPGIVHRLDKDTSGLMLVALDERTRLALSGMFARQEVFKEYLALVHGVPARAEEDIDAPVGRHPTRKTLMAVLAAGKPARSRRRTLICGQGFSLEAVRIFSGRTHQVRVHMQHVGHPLWGDASYGPKLPPGAPGAPGAPGCAPACDAACKTACDAACVSSRGAVAGRQMLHAWKLSFEHPFPEHIPATLPEGLLRNGNTLSFCCPPPEDFSSAVRALVYRPLRVVITGSPGCGKSSLLAWFREAGYPVFSADAEIAALYEPGQDGWQLLRAYFGDRFVHSDESPVDKRALGKAMQEEQGVRKEVEALMHPLIGHRLEAFWQKQQGLAVAEIPLYLETGGKKAPAHCAGVTAGITGTACGTAENAAGGAAGGAAGNAAGAAAGAAGATRTTQITRTLGTPGTPETINPPVLVGVYASFPVREKRLREKRGWSEETVATMESWQWPELVKMRACNLVVNNSGLQEDLPARAEKLLQQLRRHAAKREQHALLGFQSAWSCQRL